MFKTVLLNIVIRYVQIYLTKVRRFFLTEKKKLFLLDLGLDTLNFTHSSDK